MLLAVSSMLVNSFVSHSQEGKRKFANLCVRQVLEVTPIVHDETMEKQLNL